MILPTELEAHRVALTGHCYRMLGSEAAADDAVQETMLRAWNARDKLTEKAALRAWMYRIATRVCLDTIDADKRRARPMDLQPAGTIHDELVPAGAETWVEPISDAHAIPADANPAERAILRESIRLAFVATLQHLPPRQRAALLLTEVLGFSAAEAAEALESSVASINSALQRARATLAEREPAETPGPLTDEQRSLLAQYVAAFERWDVTGLTGLLRDDVRFNMPPFPLWLQGPDAVAGWLRGRGAACEGSRLVPVDVCGGPGFGQYKPAPEGGHKPWALVVLEWKGDKIAGWTSFLETERLFPKFGLPMSLEGHGRLTAERETP